MKTKKCPTCSKDMAYNKDRHWWICPNNGDLIKDDLESNGQVPIATRP